MSKIIMSPVDPRTATEIERKQLYFLLVDSANEDIPCIICGSKTDERSVYTPDEEFRHVYGLDLCDMKSIIYGICKGCQGVVNEIQLREKLKLAQRAGEVMVTLC